MDATCNNYCRSETFEAWTKWSPDLGQYLTDLADILSGLLVEQCHVVLLRDDFSIASQLLLSEGNEYSTAIDYLGIIKFAVKNNAQYIFLLHNHPSGDPTPSEQDIRATYQLETYCRSLGFVMLDHFIISYNQCFSFRRSGPWAIVDEDVLTRLPLSTPAKQFLGLLHRNAQPIATEDLTSLDGLTATVAARAIVELAHCGLVAGMPNHGNVKAIRLTPEGVKAGAHPNSTYLF